MAVRIPEIDALHVRCWPTKSLWPGNTLDAGLDKSSKNLYVPCLAPQSDVVQLGVSANCYASSLEQSDLTITRSEEPVGLALEERCEAQKLNVELPRPLVICDVQYNVVDTAGTDLGLW